MRPMVGDALLIVLVAVALFAMLWGSIYQVPDLTRVSYGLPLNWGVDTTSMAIDLVFWFTVIIALDRYVSRKN